MNLYQSQVAKRIKITVAMIRSISLYCLLVFLIPAPPQAAAASITIRISTQWPLPSSNNFSFLHFKERVEAESKGDIRVEIYDNAKLYGDSTVAEAISSGAVEMGFVTLSRYAAMIPAADLFQLPFLFNTQAIAEAARSPESEIRQAIDSAILVLGKSRVLWWVSSGPMVLLSNEASVADPQNLRGKTIRTFGPIMAAVMQAFRPLIKSSFYRPHSLPTKKLPGCLKRSRTPPIGNSRARASRSSICQTMSCFSGAFAAATFSPIFFKKAALWSRG
jgi:hypothetical protein